MKFLLPLLLVTTSLFAQNPCEDFLALIGQRDIHKSVIDFKENCGPFEEKIEWDGMSKTWTSKEKGIIVTLVNRAKDHTGVTKFEVMSVELRTFTDKGGYKGEFPLGFRMGMDYKMVKDHIKSMKEVQYERNELGKKRSYFTYTGAPSSALQDRQIKVYISQYDGKSITSMRMRLK